MKIEVCEKSRLWEIKNKIRRFFSPDARIKLILRERGIFIYKPKMSRAKLFVAIFLCLVCILTPATNWAIPLLIGWSLK